jgi:hypothetical protein
MNFKNMNINDIYKIEINFFYNIQAKQSNKQNN